MQNKLIALAGLAFVLGCGSTDSDDPVNIQGSFIGDYTTSLQPGVVFQGVLQLTQSGVNVTGTLTSNAGRAATVIGTVNGSRLTATFTYTDGCTGSASSTADITTNATKLVGNYISSDCLGNSTGGYSLVKQ